MLQWTSNFQKRNKPKMFYFTLKNSVDQRSMNEKSPALPTKKQKKFRQMKQTEIGRDC